MKQGNKVTKDLRINRTKEKVTNVPGKGYICREMRKDGREEL
jgi:hypothetical protein